MANKLQETIKKAIIKSVNYDETYKNKTIEVQGYVDVEKATEAILQAFRDVVPEAKQDWYRKTAFGNLKKEPRAEVWGYNQCRADILKELGGGNE